MAADRTIGRYRRWYARLLRLYPRPYRDRFGEPMAQTFTDLIREHTDAEGGVHAIALGTFAETTVQIMREHMTQLMQTRAVVRWVLITAALLAVPALAMALNLAIPDPGSATQDGMNWSPMDFALMGVLILGSGLLFEYAVARAGTVAHRTAVGMMDVENGNLLYVLVLFVALVGAAIGRFEPREASIAMFAAATTHVVVVALGLMANLGPTILADAFFVLAWLAAGVLFRQAHPRSMPAA